jgi:hypothetical protein
MSRLFKGGSRGVGLVYLGSVDPISGAIGKKLTFLSNGVCAFTCDE